jgi:hypothetical protein
MAIHLNMGGNDYEYEGQQFELHPYCGPCPLNKKGDPVQNIPDSFWGLFNDWNALSDEEKQATLVRTGGHIYL